MIPSRRECPRPDPPRWLDALEGLAIFLLPGLVLVALCGLITRFPGCWR